MTVDEAARRIGLAPREFLQCGDGVLKSRFVGGKQRRRLAETTVIDGKDRVAHFGPACHTENAAIEVPTRPMQIEHRRRAGMWMLPVPGMHSVAIVQGQVEYFRAGQRLAPPPALVGFRRENGLPLPGVQLRAAYDANQPHQCGRQQASVKVASEWSA